jgi:hypothetical protein
MKLATLLREEEEDGAGDLLGPSQPAHGVGCHQGLEPLLAHLLEEGAKGRELDPDAHIEAFGIATSPALSGPAPSFVPLSITSFGAACGTQVADPGKALDEPFLRRGKQLNSF